MRKYILFTFLAIGMAVSAQPDFTKLQKVNPTTDEVTIRNFSSIAIDISGDALCHNGNGVYVDSLAILYGNLTVPKGDSIIFSMVLNDTGDLNFATALSCTQNFFMKHYVQWGDSGQASEAAANQKSLWTSGDFLPLAPCYKYDHFFPGKGILKWQAQWIGIEDFTTENPIEVYPNPVDDFLFVQNLEGDFSYQIFDALGREIHAGISDSSIPIEVKRIPQGMYSLHIFQDGKRARHRFLKE